MAILFYILLIKNFHCLKKIRRIFLIKYDGTILLPDSCVKNYDVMTQIYTTKYQKTKSVFRGLFFKKAHKFE